MIFYSRVKTEESGQAIVECALVLPLLILILCGILDFGWIYANQYKVENAAFSAARYASIYAETMSEDSLIESVEERARSNLYGGGEDAVVEVNLGGDSVSVTVTQPVRTITFLASTIFGQYYSSSSTSVSSY